MLSLEKGSAPRGEANIKDPVASVIIPFEMILLFSNPKVEYSQSEFIGLLFIPLWFIFTVYYKIDHMLLILNCEYEPGVKKKHRNKASLDELVPAF